MPIIEYANGDTVYQAPTMQGNYPTYVFPPVMGEAISEVSMNLKLPVELAAHAALGVVSLVCQDFIRIQCPNFDPAPCSLYLKTLGITSGGKSVMEQRFLRAVLAYERKQKEDVEAKLAIYHATLKIWLDDDRRLAKKYRDAELDSDEAHRLREERVLHEQKRPVEPKVRELRFADLSPQGLRDMLVANGGVGVMSPDAGSVVNGMLFSQPAVLSGYWSSEDHPVALAGGNRRPVEPRLTISVMLQEAPFSDYMKRRGRDAFGVGLLARFLVVAPKINDLQWQETCVEEMPEPKLKRFNERATQVLNRLGPTPAEPLVLRLSDLAKRYWKYFKDALNHELNKDEYSNEVKSFFRKLAQQASRIAALFHYFDDKPGDISADAMKGAITLCEWYAFEYIRIFTPYATSQRQTDSDAARKLLDWLQEAFANPWRYPKLSPGQYTERDLSNYSSIRKNPEMLRNAIDALWRQGQISVDIGKKNGRIIIYPAANFAGQPRSFFHSQQAATSGASGCTTFSNVPPIRITHNGQNNQPQATSPLYEQTPNSGRYVVAETGNFVTEGNPRNTTPLKPSEAGHGSMPNLVKTKEAGSNNLEEVRRALTEMAWKAFGS